MKFTVVSLILMFLTLPAQARVFDIKDEKVGGYLRGGYASAPMDNTLQSKSVGSGSTVDYTVPYNLSGEFGFIYGNPNIQFRFGVEIIRPPDKKNEQGKDAGGTQWYSMNSELSVVVPKVGVDLTLKKGQTSRLYAGGSVGYASLTGRNSYTFTAAGTTQYGLVDFYEDLRGTTQQYEGWIGYESHLSDSTTWSVEGLYKGLLFSNIDHYHDATTFQGAVVKGDHAIDNNRSAREIDMSQIFVNIALRFWIF